MKDKYLIKVIIIIALLWFICGITVGYICFSPNKVNNYLKGYNEGLSDTNICLDEALQNKQEYSICMQNKLQEKGINIIIT
jgi:hypothetical protein